MFSFYKFVKITVGIIFHTLYRVKIIGAENVPRTGGIIVAPNHISNLDPPLLGSLFPRDDLYFLAKDELFHVPIFGFVIKNLKAFPIRRGEGDVYALKTSINLLDSGNCLLVFPEGTRKKQNKNSTPKKGIGLLAKKSKAVVLPVKIINTNKWFIFKKIYLIYGKPLDVRNIEDYSEISSYIISTIKNIQVEH
jgi:1-acyl-sn-glycerol-3-phosphate acyltransferase